MSSPRMSRDNLLEDPSLDQVPPGEEVPDEGGFESHITPAKARWLNAFHRVRQQMEEVRYGSCVLYFDSFLAVFNFCLPSTFF